MRQNISEFLWEKATYLIARRELAERLMVESLLGLLDRAIDKAVESQLSAHDLRSDKRVLHQFENILLRYENPDHWRNFLEGLKRRNKLGGMLKELLQWFAPEDNGPANQCLDQSVNLLSEFHYGEIKGVRRNSFPPMEEEDWQRFSALLKEQLRPVVLRELLLRAVKGALHGPR